MTSRPTVMAFWYSKSDGPRSDGSKMTNCPSVHGLMASELKLIMLVDVFAIFEQARDVLWHIPERLKEGSFS